jgi:hypothetical protein
MSFKLLIFLALTLGAASAGAHPKIYSYLDSDGVRHYTDVPDDIVTSCLRSRATT